MRVSAGYLFSNGDWFAVQQSMEQTLADEVRGFDADRMLTTEPTALADYFIQRFSIDLPVLGADDISVEQREVDIDVRHRFDYGFRGDGPGTVRGVEYEVHIPFEGDGGMFSVRPTTFSSMVPQAAVEGQRLVMFVRDVQMSNEKVESEIDGFVASVKQYLAWLGNTTTAWNGGLQAKVTSLVEARRRKLIADRTSASNLKFKIRERPGASRTYVAPEVRRKVTPVLPPTNGKPWAPEPVLEMTQYDHILAVITDAARTMEYSPAAFAAMDEEDLRTQFLFQLNGHYQGQATAETFNKQGKTDILIRSQGKNIFIGECKFWGGAKVLTETLDQVLGYTSWHDTKVAVIMFNRNKNFTSVLEQVVQVVTGHPNCKHFVSKISDAQFRFIFKNKEDALREMTLTVMVFNVPLPD